MDNYTPEQYEELVQVEKNNVCAECGAELTIHTVPERKVLEVGCVQNRDHKGFVQRESYTQLMRRGATAPDVLVEAMKKRMLPKDITPEDFTRTLNKIQVKFPDIARDMPTAALFLLDAIRLNLEPLLGEIIPLVFNKDKPKPIVVPFVTEAGELSGASRACQDDWNGPPRVMPLRDYLLSLEHLKHRPLDEIKQMVRDTAEDLCKDPDAHVWVALGKRRSDTTEVKDLPPQYGWFTKDDEDDAVAKRTPAAKMPGNMARIRAVRRWTHETYPEWRAKMIVLTGEWQERSAGVIEARKVIEGEYKMIGEQPSGKATQKKKDAGAPHGTEPSGTEEPEDLITPAPETEATKMEREILETSAKVLRGKGWENKRVWGEIWKILGDKKVLKYQDIPADKVHDVANRLAELKDIA
jgi:hypothetical protein